MLGNSSVAERLGASQGLGSMEFVREPEGSFLVHKTSPLISVQSQMYPAHIALFCFLFENPCHHHLASQAIKRRNIFIYLQFIY
jgi:hypothetical protein